jgi:hypothetical protein
MAGKDQSTNQAFKNSKRREILTGRKPADRFYCFLQSFNPCLSSSSMWPMRESEMCMTLSKVVMHSSYSTHQVMNEPLLLGILVFDQG